MRPLSLAWVALFLACEVRAFTAKGLKGDLHILHRKKHEPLEDRVGREALNYVNGRFNTREELAPRIASLTSASPSSGIPTNLLSDPMLNATVATACSNAFSNITSIGNSAGVGVCYNVLFFNNQTGQLGADVRLYQISPPSGSFAGIQSSDLVAEFKYQDALSSQLSTLTKRGSVNARRSNSSMTPFQHYSIVAQFNQNLTLTRLSETDMMALAIPQFALRGTSPTTKEIVSTVVTSASTVYFVAGLFSGKSAGGASASLPSAALAAAQKASAFVMPGTTFGIFPSGGILTWAWTVLFVFTFGLGTIGRIMSRKKATVNKVKIYNANANVKPPKAKKLKVGSKKSEAKAEQKVEMVDIDISYHKTFGDRPNYYVERLPSVRRPANF